MPDQISDHPRLAAIRDVPDPDRSDLEVARAEPGGATVRRIHGDAAALPLVRFRGTSRFGPDGVSLGSDSTLRFRSADGMRCDLGQHGFAVEDVRGAPDRPGRELVFVARRPS